MECAQEPIARRRMSRFENAKLQTVILKFGEPEINHKTYFSETLRPHVWSDMSTPFPPLRTISRDFCTCLRLLDFAPSDFL